MKYLRIGFEANAPILTLFKICSGFVDLFDQKIRLFGKGAEFYPAGEFQYYYD